MTAGAFGQNALAPNPGVPTATPAAAEETVQLSTFEVTASKDVGYISTNSADASRMNTPIKDLPQNITVFNQQLIQDLLATSTDQLLAYDPSVLKTSENDAFIVRGTSSVGTNTFGGFAQPEGFGSQPLANIERVEVLKGPAAILYGSGNFGATIDRITKKPLPDPQYSIRTIFSANPSARLEYDFNPGPVSAGLGQKLLFRVDGAVERGHTWFNQRKWEDNIAADLAWAPTRNTKVVLEYMYDHTDGQAGWETPMHNGDPIGITTGDGVYRKIPRDINWVSPGDFRRITRRVSSIDVTHIFSDNLQFRSQAQYGNKDQHLQETWAESAGLTILRDTALMPRSWRDRARHNTDYNLREELVGKFDIGSTHERFIAGMSIVTDYFNQLEKQSVSNWGGFLPTDPQLLDNGWHHEASPGNGFNYFPNLTLAQFMADPHLAGFNTNLLLPLNIFDRSHEPAVPPIGPGSLNSDGSFNANSAPLVGQRPPLWPASKTSSFNGQHDYYFNNQLGFFDDRLVLVAGGRYDNVHAKSISFTSGDNPYRIIVASAPTQVQYDDALTGSFGAVWHLNAEKNLTLYGNMYNAFSPVFTIEPDGTQLRPETGQNKEIGLRFSLLDNRLSCLLDYYSLLENGVVQDDGRPGRTGYHIQTDGLHTTGAELTLNGAITRNWQVFGGVSYGHSTNSDGTPREYVPKIKFSMFNRYQISSGPLKGVSLSLGTIYTGSRPCSVSGDDRAGIEPSWTIPAAWRVDGIVNYRFHQGHRFTWDVSLKISNMLDNQNLYYVAENYRFAVDPGREWQMAMGCRF